MNRHASVNRIFRLIWNEARGAFVPIAETSRARGKRSQRALVTATVLLAAGAAHAGPGGGQVTSGSGSIAQSGSATTIQQSSQNLAINWQSFNVAASETVNFIQPSASAVAVNRILGSNGSVILGHLSANGQVYLINPNGIIFGAGAQLNVGGLVASTLGLAATASASSSETFSGSSSAGVTNAGTIVASSGGSVALLGSRVANSGVISARLGTVALGAGSAVTLSFNGTSLVGMQVDRSVLASVASNGGLIRADGGTVLMTAGARQALLASVVNNSGVIEARTLDNHDGSIRLLAGMDAGTVHVGGTLDASAPAGGDGGFIETSAAQVEIANSAHITSAAATGLSGSWLIDPTDFIIAASGGDITGAQLSGALTGGSVLIQSGSGGGGTAGDILVNDTVSWSANTLTLSAQNDIQINSQLNGSGSATLALQYGQGAVQAGNTASYAVNAPVNLPAGAHFSTRQGSDGATIGFTVITSLGQPGDALILPGTATLQGIAQDLLGNFVLGSNIDASASASWNACSSCAAGGAGSYGFTPIGVPGSPYQGTFDGLGHVISNLSINRQGQGHIGLFGESNGTLQNVGLVGGSVTGSNYVGELVGQNLGAILHSYATGAVQNYGNLTGGLVGNNDGSISNSYASGQVNGQNNFVGGLVGFNTGSISQSHASGAVQGASYVGGLVGDSQGSIDQSYASGAVAGSSFGTYVGGLLGYLNPGAGPTTVSNSYATGNVSGNSNVGGLVGVNPGLGGTISNAYATGTVTGNSEVGGLVGYNVGILSNAFYDAGAVLINGHYVLTAGGLSDSQYLDWFTHAESLDIGNYAANLPAGTGGFYNVNSVPGLLDLLGFSESNAADNFRLTSSIDLPAGLNIAYFAGSFDGAGYTLGNLTLNLPNSNLGMFGFLPSSSTTITHLGLTNVSVTGNSNVGALVGSDVGGAAISDCYATGSVSGQYYVGGLVGQAVSYLGPSSVIDHSYFSGAVSGTYYVGGLIGSSTGSVSSSYAAGSVTASGYAGGLIGANYGNVSKSYASGSVSGSTTGGLVGANYGTIANSFYDLSANPGLTGQGTSNAGNADVAGSVWGLSGTQMQTQANFTSATSANGSVNPNWDFAGSWVMYEGFTAPLLRAFMTPLTVTASNASKTYDGAAYAGGNGVGYTVSVGDGNLFGTPTYGGSAQGATHVGNYSISPGGLYSDQQGYLLSYASGTLSVAPAALSVSNAGVTKVYDGRTSAALNDGVLSGVIAGDQVTLTQSGTFASKNVGSGIAVNDVASISGADTGDYLLIQPIGLTGSITPAPLTVTGTRVASKVYDGTTSASLSGGMLAGVIAGDTLTLTQAGAFVSKDAGAGIAVIAADHIGGASAVDYVLTQPLGLSGTIVASGSELPPSAAMQPAGVLDVIAQIDSNLAPTPYAATMQASLIGGGVPSLTIIDGGVRLPQSVASGSD